VNLARRTFRLRPILQGICLGLALSAAGWVHAAAGGPAWAELTPAERLALHPLQSQWQSIDATRKQKWREVAARLPNLPRDQQIRMQARMAEWVSMTPAQRNTARLHFETTRQVPMSERQALWDAYQALPEAQRKALADKASQRAVASAVAPVAAAPSATGFDRTQAKSNVIAAAKPREALPRSIGPGTVQASVGASTRPLTQRPAPPRHQQAGMPKIAATGDFVNSATLLPQRGPQGAAAEQIVAPQ
jgi:hypothetical protein